MMSYDEIFNRGSSFEGMQSEENEGWQKEVKFLQIRGLTLFITSQFIVRIWFLIFSRNCYLTISAFEMAFLCNTTQGETLIV